MVGLGSTAVPTAGLLNPEGDAMMYGYLTEVINGRYACPRRNRGNLDGPLAKALPRFWHPALAKPNVFPRRSS